MKKFFPALLAAGLFLFAACEPDPFLTLDKTSLEFTDAGGSQTVSVEANNSWDIVLESTETFFSVSPASGSGNGYFTVTVTPNTGQTVRSGQILVVCHSHDMTASLVISLTQSCPAGFASVSVDEISALEDNQISPEGATVKLTVEANASWTLRCDASDVNLDLDSGSAGTSTVVATVPACPVFEGRTITFELTCRTAAGGMSDSFKLTQKGGVLVYGGETYHAVKMKDGKWWMKENLRYVPAGMTPSADVTAASNGIWYPVVIDELTADKATVKFSQDDADIRANGYLYSSEVALGLKPGDMTADNAATFEGAQGICPAGWHIPTKADIVALVGKTADKNDTNADAPYFDPALSGGSGSAALLNADGWNAGAWGALSIANTAAAKGTLMGAIKAYQKGMNTGYIAGSTMHQVTTNDDGSLKNVQFVAFMPNMNIGTYNGAWNNYRNGVSVRCVKND